MQLRDIAHSRAGDKGNISNLSLIAYDAADYPFLAEYLTAEKVREHFAGIVHGEVRRYEIPSLGALNFVMHDALGGGVTRSLALDAHGKCLSAILLEIDIGDTVLQDYRESESHRHFKNKPADQGDIA
jgi:hypothetical protein